MRWPHRLRLHRAAAASAVAVAVLAALVLVSFHAGLAAVSRASAQGRAAQHAIDAVPAELRAGNLTAAGHSLDVAAAALAAARADLDARPLRLVGMLPLARDYPEAARRLIDAADVLTGAGRQLVVLDDTLDGTQGFLFWPQQVDLGTMQRVGPLAAAVAGDLDRARSLLTTIPSLPGGGAIDAARAAALREIDQVAATVGVLRNPQPLLDALGATTARRYLLIARDDTTMLPSGGRPVAAAVVTVRDGAISVGPGPSVTTRAFLPTSPTDPWLLPAGSHDLADAIAAPSFPIAAQEALSWFRAVTGQAADGVVSVSARGIARLLAVEGSGGFPAGATAQTVSGLLTPPAGPLSPGFETRARKVLIAVAGRAVDLHSATARLAALGSAAAHGELATFTTIGAAEALAVHHGFGGGLAPVADDVVGTVASGSPTAVRTRTRQDVAIGSKTASAVRTTTVTLAAVSTITQYVPFAARDVTLFVDGRLRGSREFLDIGGRRAYSVGLVPGQHTVRVSYTLPRASKAPYQVVVDGRSGSGSVLTLHVTTWAMHGQAADPRWSASGDGYTAVLPGNGQHVLTLAPAAGGGGILSWLWRDGGRAIGWLLACLLLSVATRRRPWIPLATALVLYGTVPMAAGGAITGVYHTGEGLLTVHPATWLVLSTVGVLLLTRPREVLDAVRANRWALAVVGAVVIDAAVTAVFRHSGGWSQIVQTLVAAPALAVLAVVICRRRRSTVLRLSDGYLLFSLALAALAIVEALAGHDVVYASVYAHLEWAQVFARHGFRAATTLDEPLNTALVLVSALPIARGRLARRAYVVALALLLLGVVATGSRTAFVLGVGYAIWPAARAMRRRGIGRTRLVGWAGLVTLASVAVAASPLGRHFVGRAIHDGGSGSLRIAGLRAFAAHLPSRLMTGSGVGTSEHLTRAWMHAANSAENPFVMLSVDLGVVAAVGLVAALLWFAGIRLRRPTYPQQALLLALAASATYSSFATPGVASAVLWLLAGLAAAHGSVAVELPAQPPAVEYQPWRLGPPEQIGASLVPRPATLSDWEATGPLVSAVMAARDAERTVGDAVRSVVGQTLSDWELIVVDDGSSDGTAEAARKAAAGDPRVRVVKLDTGAGRGAARNRALAEATGRYIAVCDADDRSRADRFARQVAFLETHPAVGVVGGQVANFGAWGGPEVVYRYPVDEAAVAARFARGQNPIPHQASMIRRALFDSVGGYSAECVRAQDLELFLRMARVTAMTNLDDVVLDYRHDRRTSLRYWLDNGRWRRYAVARAAAASAGEVPDPATFRRGPVGLATAAYDVLAYARNRLLLAARGARSL